MSEVNRMKKECTIEEKLEYLKYKAEYKDTPSSEKLKILEFFSYLIGLFGEKFDLIIFLRELNKLTADIDPNQTEQ